MSGTRIWLSGAIPEQLSANRAAALRRFVTSLARQAFQRDFTLLHGCQPELTPILLDRAKAFRKAAGSRPSLSLIASRTYEDGGRYLGLTPSEIREVAAFSTQANLGLMRDALAAQTDVFVAIGGKWWNEAGSKGGVPQELLLAVNRGLPCFLLGAFGGALKGHVDRDPHLLSRVRNGLTPGKNKELFELDDDPEKMAELVLDQIDRLPLYRRETAGGQRYRILCLDGGGIRGAFTAAVLAQWEELLQARQPNASIASHFDLIAGTSTGGIIALGLGLGLTAGEIAEFYKHEGPAIFSMTGVRWLCQGWIQRVANKFDAAKLERCLRSIFRKQSLGDSKSRLLIPSYNLTANQPTLFRTSHGAGKVEGYDHLPAVEVARATSAAPTYFEPAEVVVKDWSRQAAIDGGIWANCPAAVAVGEALHVLGYPLDRIDLLSLGTAGLPPWVKNPALQGEAGWVLQAADLFMNSQQDATLEQARRLLGADSFVRVDDENTTVSAMDDVNSLDLLLGRGRAIGEKRWGGVRAQFLNGIPAAPWRHL